MDLLTPGGSRWRIARSWRRTYAEPPPWAPELAGETARPTEGVGRRPLVVWRDGTAIHVEPAPQGREAVAARVESLAAAVRTTSLPDA